MIRIIHAITDLGDSGLIAALVLAGTGYFLISGHRREAAGLAGAFILAVLGVLAAKLVFMACGGKFGGGVVHSPSGHAALAMAVFGTCAMLMGRQMTGGWRFIPFILMGLLITLIALSRVWLGFHSPAEVTLGLLVGESALLLNYALVLGDRPSPPFNPQKFALWILCISILFYGIRLPVEPLIEWFAAYMQSHHTLC